MLTILENIQKKTTFYFILILSNIRNNSVLLDLNDFAKGFLYKKQDNVFYDFKMSKATKKLWLRCWISLNLFIYIKKLCFRSEETQSDTLKRKSKKTVESSNSRSPAGHKTSDTQPRRKPGSDSPSRRRVNTNSPSRKSAESPSRRGSPSRGGARSAESPSRRVGSAGNYPESPSRKGHSSGGGKRSESPSRGGNNTTPPAESPVRQPGSPGNSFIILSLEYVKCIFHENLPNRVKFWNYWKFNWKNGGPFHLWILGYRIHNFTFWVDFG